MSVQWTLAIILMIQQQGLAVWTLKRGIFSLALPRLGWYWRRARAYLFSPIRAAQANLEWSYWSKVLVPGLGGGLQCVHMFAYFCPMHTGGCFHSLLPKKDYSNCLSFRPHEVWLHLASNHVTYLEPPLHGQMRADSREIDKWVQTYKYDRSHYKGWFKMVSFA